MARSPTAIARTPAATPTPSGPTALEQFGNFWQNAFPALNAARESTVAGVNAANATGDYARAAGRATTGELLQMPAGFVSDVARPVTAALRAVPSFLGGAVGSGGSATDAIVTPKVPVAIATNPVASAMAQGAAAPATPISAADEIHSFIANRLKAGVTNHDLTALSGIAQAVPALTKVQQTNKDKIAGTAANVTDAEFAAELAAAKKLGANSPEYETAVQKATDKYRQNLATLLGVNPQGLSMQAMLANQQPDQ